MAAKNKKSQLFSKHLLRLAILFASGIIIFSLLILIDHRIVGSDDTIFQTQILPYHSVFEWIQYRYFNWSGRVFSEGFIYLLSPAPFYFWQILNVVAYAIFSAMFFIYYRLFSTSRDHIKDYAMLIIALCLPFLMHSAVLSDGITWMTGSIVYFWASTLGLVALYPLVFHSIRKRLPSVPIIVISIIATIVGILSQEQVAVTLTGLSFVFLAYGVIRKVKDGFPFPTYQLFIFVLSVATFLTTYLAPGNNIRLDLELVRWLPDFYTTPLLDRLHYSYRWLLDALVNHTGFILSLAWLTLSGLFMAKPQKKVIDYLFAATFATVGVLIITKGNPIVAYWFEFYASWKPTITNNIVALNIIPWGIVLVLTLIAPFILFKKNLYFAVIVSILFAVSFACAAIMILSPTLYASSWRSLFVSSVVLLFVLYLLIDRLLTAYRGRQYQFILTIVIVTLASSHYLYQAARLIEH